MRKLSLTLLVIVALLALTSPVAAHAPVARTFIAPLSGAAEVPARDTNAKGLAVFHTNKHDTELSYLIVVSKLDNPVAAHIHCGAAGVNGPVGVTLFTGTAASGRANGLLAKGTITAPDPGNACGWTDLAAVLSAMRSGNTYTNVHTNDGVPPTNTGPGDFQSGEIRGQNKAVGAHR